MDEWSNILPKSLQVRKKATTQIQELTPCVQRTLCILALHPSPEKKQQQKTHNKKTI